MEINTIKMSVGGLKKRPLGLHIYFKSNNISIRMFPSKRNISIRMLVV